MMAADALSQALDVVAGPLRGLSGLARLLWGVAAGAVIVAVAAWLARVGWLAGPEWVLIAWSLVAMVLMASLVFARRAIGGLGPWHVGGDLEASGAWRHGALTTILDPPASGTSLALHAAAAGLRAREVRLRGPEALRPAVGRERTRSRRGAAALLVALIGLAAARPATGAPARLWHPIGAWHALIAPVRLRARAATVARGDPAVLDVTAIGHRHATLRTRAPGEPWHATDVLLDADGNASVTTPPLAADLVAWVEAGGRRSPDVHVTIRIAAFLGAFTASAHYPAYLGLEDEILPTAGDTLVLPEGTRLSLNGRATTPLESVRLSGPDGVVALTVDGSSFHGELAPRESGRWRVTITPANGGELEGDPPLLPVRIVVDSAPVVEIPVPGVDTVATPSMTLALVIAMRDDHGITSASIESRRGNAGSVTRTPLALPAGGGERALVTTMVDLAALGLRPGDTLRYAATARDNAPARHVGRSREYLVRIPTEAEQRAARARQTAQAVTAVDSLARQAARLQRTEEDLARERQRVDPNAGDARPGDDGQKDPLASEAARKAAAVAQAQQALLDAAARLQRSVQQLRDAAQRDGAADSTLARQLDEINTLLEKALSPALRDKLAALQQAVKALDAEQTQQSLQDLAKQQAQLKEAMEQAHELLRRAALETELASMGKDARQLASEQHALTGRLATSDPAAARDEQALAARADSLGAGLDRAAQEIMTQRPQQELRQAAQQARGAANTMKQAAKSGQAGRAGDAQAQAKQAEDQLNPLSKKIDDSRQQMQAEMRTEVKQALDRALEETARLAQQQLAVAQEFEAGALVSQARLEQGLVEEGAAKLMQQLAAVSSMNALVSPQAAIALSEARRLMREAIAGVASVNANVRDASTKAGDAVDLLAVAAFSLMQSKDKVNGSQSGSGVQEAIEEMQRMAGKQGQLAQQGAGVIGQGNVSAAQMMRLALQQRALALQLERMRGGGQLPGAGEMAREARELSRTLEGGRLNRDVVDRQQKLFKRMLDAGRTLQGEADDEKKERQSTAARDAPPGVPPPLDPRIRNGTGDIRLPSWESLQRLSPEERRRVVDYFQRLTQGSGP